VIQHVGTTFSAVQLMVHTPAFLAILLLETVGSRCLEMLSRKYDDDAFMNHVVFSDKTTFHVSCKVNRHNCRIWGSENPHEVMEHERDSPKLNVCCALTSDSVIGPFFFEETTVTGASYLNML
jgi:hypothetical protein